MQNFLILPYAILISIVHTLSNRSFIISQHGTEYVRVIDQFRCLNSGPFRTIWYLNNRISSSCVLHVSVLCFNNSIQGPSVTDQFKCKKRPVVNSKSYELGLLAFAVIFEGFTRSAHELTEQLFARISTTLQYLPHNDFVDFFHDFWVSAARELLKLFL